MSDPDPKNQPLVSQEELDRHDDQFAKDHRDIADQYPGDR